MPTCQNCDSHVTKKYVQVFSPNNIEEPRVCPNCEDIIREKSGFREKKT